MSELAWFEGYLGNHVRSLDLDSQAAELFSEAGDDGGAALAEWNRIGTLLEMGDYTEAHGRSREAIDRIFVLHQPQLAAKAASTFAEILLVAGHPEAAARLIGSADAQMERLGVKNPPAGEKEAQAFLWKCQELLGREESQRGYEAGGATMVEDLLVELRDL